MPPTSCEVDAIVLGSEKPSLAIGFTERVLGLHDCVHEYEEST